MLPSPRHTCTTKHPYRTAISLVLLLVVVMLAIPASYLNVVKAVESSAMLTTTGSVDGDHKDCPCCPGENSTDTDDCSKCSYCSVTPTLAPTFSTAYTPVVTYLISREQFTRLPEVHIPILVPPQNIA